MTEPKLGTICWVWGPFTFYNGALHGLAHTLGYPFILSFHISDESFHEIMMPRNHFDSETTNFSELAVYKVCQLILFLLLMMAISLLGEIYATYGLWRSTVWPSLGLDNL